MSSSVRAITELGLMRVYEGLLPATLHPIIIGAVAGSWLDISVAIEHYRALEAIDLDPSRQLVLGETVGAAVRKYLIGSSTQSTQTVGATPWVILGHTQRTWDRLYVGGDVSIEETGPQQFVRTIYGLPLCEIPYFRRASLGMLQAVVSRWCTKCDVVELASTSTSIKWRVSWS